MPADSLCLIGTVVSSQGMFKNRIGKKKSGWLMLTQRNGWKKPDNGIF